MSRWLDSTPTPSTVRLLPAPAQGQRRPPGETTFTPSEGPINRQSRASCNPGEHAVGGGGHVQALTADRLGEYFTFLVHSAPIASNGEPAADATSAVGWLVEATNTAHTMSGQSGRDANLISYVVCERD